MIDENSSGLKQKVLDCLSVGHESANSRQWIAMHIGIPDRTVRAVIEDLRADGFLICNDQDGNGYYLANTAEEVERQYNQDLARALSILRRLKYFRSFMKGLADRDQITFNDLIIDEVKTWDTFTR